MCCIKVKQRHNKENQVGYTAYYHVNITLHYKRIPHVLKIYVRYKALAVVNILPVKYGYITCVKHVNQHLRIVTFPARPTESTIVDNNYKTWQAVHVYASLEKKLRCFNFLKILVYTYLHTCNCIYTTTEASPKVVYT